MRVDNMNHLKFKYWSFINCDEAPKNTKKIVYYNDTKSDLVFNLNL